MDALTQICFLCPQLYTFSACFLLFCNSTRTQTYSKLSPFVYNRG